MKNSFKLGLLTLSISVAAIACDPSKNVKNGIGSNSVDSPAVKIDTLANDTVTHADSGGKDTTIHIEVKKTEVKRN